MSIVHQYIRSVNKEWHFDDTNFTTFPVATTTLVNDQRDYHLDSSVQRLKQLEVLDASGKYYTLTRMEQKDATLMTEKWQETAGKPSHYYMVGRSIVLYPKPDTTQVTASAGLRATFEREMDFFATTDTTQEPGFDEAYHSILYYGPAYEWAMTNNNQGVSQLCMTMLGGFEGLNALVKKHYSDRNDDDTPVLSREHKSYK
jgi:hypothetical protein